MIRRRVQGVEAVILILDLRTICHHEADLAETADDIIGHLRQRVKMAEQAAAAGKGTIARALAQAPQVLLLDEPCSALDPISTAKIEELIGELKKDYTVVIVTHNMQQAARCSDSVAYMYLGDLVEFGATNDVFFKPKRKETEDYITGRFG